MSDPASFAVVILAPRATATDAPRIADMVSTSRDAGAGAVVVAVPRGFRSPERSRVVHVGPGAGAIGAIRAAMSQLANTSVRAAMLWPIAQAPPSTVPIRTLLDAATAEPADLVAFEGDDLSTSPVLIARDAWLDLVTLGEQGLDVLAARKTLRRVPR